MLQSHDKLCGWVGIYNHVTRSTRSSWFFSHTCTLKDMGRPRYEATSFSDVFFCYTKLLWRVVVLCMRLLWKVCSSFWRLFAIRYDQREESTELFGFALPALNVWVWRVTIFEGSYVYSPYIYLLCGICVPLVSGNVFAENNCISIMWPSSHSVQSMQCSPQHTLI